MPSDAALRADVDSFLEAFKAVLSEAPDSNVPAIEEERRIVFDLLSGEQDVAFEPEEPLHKPVCRFLDQAHPANDDPLLDALSKASRPLCEEAVWRNKYRDIPGREKLFENFAFCDFVGPDGWLKKSKVTLGFTMLGPDTYYPFHSHPARELYFLMSGVSDWAVDYGEMSTRSPGAWLLHREMQAHAIQSLEEPMLAVSVWRGEIGTRSRFINPDK